MNDVQEEQKNLYFVVDDFCHQLISTYYAYVAPACRQVAHCLTDTPLNPLSRGDFGQQ